MRENEANRLMDFIRLEQKKLDFEVKQAQAKLELLQKHQRLLNLQLLQIEQNNLVKPNPRS